MSFSEEHMKLIKQAYKCLEKVADEIPFEIEEKNVELFYKDFMTLSVFADNE